MSVSVDDIRDLFLRKWAEDRVRLKVVADASCFGVVLEGYVVFEEGTDNIWLSPSPEETGKIALRFAFNDVVSCEYAEPRDAPEEDRPALESAMVCGVSLFLRSRERIFMYELPQQSS